MSTKIEWATDSWNPITGCSHSGSPGCDHCYAKRMAIRLRGRYGYPLDDPFKVTFHPDKLDEPLHWKNPRRIFLCSMGDLFHENVHRDWILRIYLVIRKCPQHQFFILTKRPERMNILFSEWIKPSEALADMSLKIKDGPQNLWLGVTVCDQAEADQKIPELLKITGFRRWVSIEPMLGPIDIRKGLPPSGPEKAWEMECGGQSSIDWVVAGAETGPGARPAHPDWFRSLRDQCQAAGVPFFLKKLSYGGRTLDGRIWDELPST